MQTLRPTIQALLGIPHVTRDMAGTVTDQAALLGLDARLGVPGLPQSATGQTTILTGHNGPAIIGEHYGPYPNQPLSANTQAAYRANLKLRSGEELRQGRAISAFLSNDFWPEPEVQLPPITARQAGTQLANLAQEHTLTFFEFWYSDLVGHKRDRARSLQMLGMLDDFLSGILETIDRNTTLLLVVSDHGNFEDWTTTKHTYNPALTILTGAKFEALVPRLNSLADLKSALLAHIFDGRYY